MSSKTKTITVAWGHFADASGPNTGTPNYRVTKVTDSTEYHPGQVLTKHEVDSLCASRAWKVTVVGFEQ